MDFCYALKALKEGLKVTRTGWNGKDMWIAIKFKPRPLSSAEVVHYHQYPTMTVPFIFMRTAQGDLVPWLASQTDLLAEDWQSLQFNHVHQKMVDSQDVSFAQENME